MARTKLPKIKLPVDPPAPPPPSTREEVQSYFLSFLAHEVKTLDKACVEWQERISKADHAARLVYDLDWSMGFFEAATRRAVYTEALEALTKPGTKATMETLTEYATNEALSKADSGSRSSSAISNLVAQGTTAAWAKLSRELRNWRVSLERADAHYGKPEAPETSK